MSATRTHRIATYTLHCPSCPSRNGTVLPWHKAVAMQQRLLELGHTVVELVQLTETTPLATVSQQSQSLPAGTLLDLAGYPTPWQVMPAAAQVTTAPEATTSHTGGEHAGYSDGLAAAATVQPIAATIPTGLMLVPCTGYAAKSHKARANTLSRCLAAYVQHCATPTDRKLKTAYTALRTTVLS